MVVIAFVYHGALTEKVGDERCARPTADRQRIGGELLLGDREVLPD
jgi:hypothetical protein